MAKVTKADIIKDIAEAHGTSKTNVQATLDAALDMIAQRLADGDTVHLPAFGAFERRHRDARTGRNPATGEKMEIAASVNVGFKPAKSLKAKMNL